MAEDEQCGDPNCGCRNMDEVKNLGKHIYELLAIRFDKGEGFKNRQNIFNCIGVALMCSLVAHIDKKMYDSFLDNFVKQIKENMDENIKRGNF